MKRILFVSTMESYPWGGSEELWSRAALHLVRGGMPVSASVKRWPNEPAQIAELRAAGIDVRFRDASGNEGRPDDFWQNIASENLGLVVLSDGANRIDLSLAKICEQFKIPLAIVFQAANECNWPPDSIATESSRLLESAAGVFCVSQSNLAVTRTQYATKLPRARVIRNPCKVPYDVNPSWPSTEKGFSLACVGRLEPASKGQDILFDVLAMEKWRKRDLRVTLYGDGCCTEGVHRLRVMHSLESVEFGGFCNNIEELWSRHHALVLPSRIEGLALAVVEALLCARPCITTDVAGNAELLQDNVGGFVAKFPRADALDEAMERAWQRRHEWRQIGEAGAAYVRKVIPPNAAAVFADVLMSLSR